MGLLFVFSDLSADNGASSAPVVRPVAKMPRLWLAELLPIEDDASDEVSEHFSHLDYVEQLLRLRDTLSLTPGQREKRAYLLDLLHVYADLAVFSEQYCKKTGEGDLFRVDDEGLNILSFLLEHSRDSFFAKRVRELLLQNEHFEPDGELWMWAVEHGLSMNEIALLLWSPKQQAAS